ncbi:Aste57867_7933 [Aphanomyces stellatus]|uniref:Aste57867_7933 protein n=1 Tax=Aphanomyces stellatus TaxID=120398 RepID=A0A485KJ00_9STRA|nr:hypothetical protein As57867_007903 [Aphanomyces stellatus]VFT84826.1 Aste57867_7933 [Aphanomyces stellatus]
MTNCVFIGCKLLTTPGHTKCDAHRGRTQCLFPECTNQTYARKMCIRHGGKDKCSIPGCDATIRSHGLCCKHGPKKPIKTCQVKECTKLVHSRGFCMRHGGGRKCNAPGCSSYSRRGGTCRRHEDTMWSVSANWGAPCKEKSTVDTDIVDWMEANVKMDTADEWATGDMEIVFTADECEMLDCLLIDQY